MSVQGWFTSESGDVESPTGWFAWTEIRADELDEIAEAFSDEFAEIAGLDSVRAGRRLDPLPGLASTWTRGATSCRRCLAL